MPNAASASVCPAKLIGDRVVFAIFIRGTIRWQVTCGIMFANEPIRVSREALNRWQDLLACGSFLWLTLNQGGIDVQRRDGNHGFAGALTPPRPLVGGPSPA
ncbi:MAG: hypothetical protein JSR77_05540 [Planctomycetes bacterium]|nr:hypothetical protein [Planctomycetota bacterium]